METATIDLAQEFEDYSRSELLDLQTKIEYALAAGKQKAEPTSADKELWDAIGEIVGYNVSLKVMIQRIGYERYVECRSIMDQLLERALPKDVRKVQRSAIRVRMLQCLADYIRDRRKTPTHPTMLRDFEFLKHAVDLQFPGYIDCQLLHKISRPEILETS